MVTISTTKRRKSLTTCVRLSIGTSLLVLVLAFVVTENILDKSCFCAFPSSAVPTTATSQQQLLRATTADSASIPCKNETIIVKEYVTVESDASPGVLSESSSSTLRSTVLQLLDSLPNNTTQRELSRATVRRMSGGKITLVTQGGVSKLPRLIDLAGRWLGPISCGIYISTKEQLDEWLDFWKANDVIQEYVSFHVLMEQPQLPLTVNRHPINRLRNLALRNAETDHVFINDVDFMTPSGAHDQIAPLVVDLKPRTMWVLPAFERFGPSKKGKDQFVTDVTLIPSTKVELLDAIQTTKTVAPFHDYFKAGHAPSNYSHWYTATERYPTQYNYLYEPYVVCHKQGLPEFFPTFRGFAFNKMSFFMEAHYMGFQFEVLPDQYVVHMNHGGRKGRNDKGGDSKYIREDFRDYLQKVYGVTKQELAKWK